MGFLLDSVNPKPFNAKSGKKKTDMTAQTVDTRSITFDGDLLPAVSSINQHTIQLADTGAMSTKAILNITNFTMNLNWRLATADQIEDALAAALGRSRGDAFEVELPSRTTDEYIDTLHQYERVLIASGVAKQTIHSLLSAAETWTDCPTSE